jgi:hypothetical protein
MAVSILTLQSKILEGPVYLASRVAIADIGRHPSLLHGIVFSSRPVTAVLALDQGPARRLKRSARLYSSGPQTWQLPLAAL